MELTLSLAAELTRAGAEVGARGRDACWQSQGGQSPGNDLVVAGARGVRFAGAVRARGA